MAIVTSKLTVEDGEKILVRRAGRYSSEDLHHAVFSVPPEPRSLEELKEGIRTRIKKRHARD